MTSYELIRLMDEHTPLEEVSEYYRTEEPQKPRWLTFREVWRDILLWWRWKCSR